MKTYRFAGLVVVALIGFPGPGFGTRSARADQIIIVNTGMVADSADTDTVSRIFLGKKSRLDGTKVQVVLLEEGATHASFLTSYIHRKPKQFLSHWRKLCFTGKGILPHSFETEEELVAHVAATPGAIGYISDTTPHPGVKVLAVQ